MGKTGARAGVTDPRRHLPSVDSLLQAPESLTWIERYGRKTVKQSIQAVLEQARITPEEPMSPADLLKRVGADIVAGARLSLRPVLNGTGVVLHTNLGRAELAPEAIAAYGTRAGYANVEYSIDTGGRGSRYDHCSSLVCELTGAEAAIITNNNAAAVSLVVNEFARGREVLISRGELVEIGGSFRIPDVVARSGGVLREVGTTNRTRLTDYAEAIGDESGLMLRVHPSNYRIEGFTEETAVEEMGQLSTRTGVPFAHDIGSGLLHSELLPGFPSEPTVRDSIEAGATLVTWSGDKLLGGPQAGLIAGTEAAVARLRKNPLLRAFRVDKGTLAALEATLLLYRDPDLAALRIPTLAMLREPTSVIEARARKALPAPSLASRVQIGVRPLRSMVGGGSFPGFELDSSGWFVTGIPPDDLASTCRASDPPLIGRIENDTFVIDFRTISAAAATKVAKTVMAAIEEVEGVAGVTGVDGAAEA